MTTRYLTGITPSGVPHLGNYAVAIRPSVRSQGDADSDHFYFLADLHSLIKSHNPVQTQRSTLEIAATWIACGLDPDLVTFYRQSDIAEIPQLTWLLTVVTGKGLLNRAHAYKAAVDKNTAAGADPDADVSAGLFMYPVLMAADIMLFSAHKVPVGRDQAQHIEMARDMAASFNHIYAQAGALLVPPEAVLDAQVATLPGLDGRKMSKSYGNTIPLFTPQAQLRKLIMGIATDSRAPGVPKDTHNSAIFQLYEAFASVQETQAMRQAFADGIAWGDAKQQLFARIDAEVGPMRAHFDALMADPARIEDILQHGAQKARAVAAPFLAQLKRAVGLRDLRDLAVAAAPASADKAALAQLKQYRDTDGQFYFKLTGAKEQLLLQSKGYASGREAGAAVKQLKQEGAAALPALAAQLATADLQDGALIAALQAWQTAQQAE